MRVPNLYMAGEEAVSFREKNSPPPISRTPQWSPTFLEAFGRKELCTLSNFTSTASLKPQVTHWRRILLLSLMLLGVASSSISQTTIKGRRSLVLEGEAAQLIVDLAGGSITNFHLLPQGISPIQWGATDNSTLPRPMGHFLCLDRWGQPSDSEIKSGMPFHGEASNVVWSVTQPLLKREGTLLAEMEAQLPMAGLKVRRHIALSQTGSFFTVREEITNVNKLGRLYNIVQHPTIGPPFLDENTLVDTNARKGFMQSSPLPNPEEPAVYWPEGRHEGQAVNLRHLTNSHDPNVVSFTVEEEYGWVTACNPTQGLLIGYLWKTAEYPWFNAWRHVEKGKPVARGLEFGTTGLHQPYPVLVKKGKIFGRALYEYLDAGEIASKSYLCFLIKIPKDYAGVGKITYSGKLLTLHERGGAPSRDLKIAVGTLFENKK